MPHLFIPQGLKLYHCLRIYIANKDGFAWDDPLHFLTTSQLYSTEGHSTYRIFQATGVTLCPYEISTPLYKVFLKASGSLIGLSLSHVIVVVCTFWASSTWNTAFAALIKVRSRSVLKMFPSIRHRLWRCCRSHLVRRSIYHRLSELHHTWPTPIAALSRRNSQIIVPVTGLSACQNFDVGSLPLAKLRSAFRSSTTKPHH
jgi:hypothetical protein